MKKIVAIPALAFSTLALTACGQTADTGAAQANAAPITAEEVAAAQQGWGDGIIAIGKAYTDKGDYRTTAKEHIAKYYAYGDEDTILFKPTLASVDQFRETPDEALSYFVGTEGSEDGGFAIKPYTKVRWENNGTVIDDDGEMAMAMGNYFFTDTKGNETKVEYSFGYEKDDAGDLKIVLHHSSLPYTPE